MYNNSVYYFIPIDEIEPAHMSHMSNSTLKTIRKSVRPIDGKIHGICSHGKLDKIPEYFRKYKGYTHKETLELVQSKDWNIYKPMHDLKKKYDFQQILSLVEEEKYIEALGIMYITVFSILKYKFYLFSFEFLNENFKWKLFNSPKLEKANESTMLLLNTFFDLVDHKNYINIDKFRLIRNDISHSFERQYGKTEILNSLHKMNDFVKEQFDTIGI